MCRSMKAASMLFAAATAWKSPVKCRFRSSIGTTCVRPPPAAPPLMPKIGPSDGSGRASTRRLALPTHPRPRHAREGVRAPLLVTRVRGGLLSLARLGRRDRRDPHDLGVGCPGEAVERSQVHLGLVL